MYDLWPKCAGIGYQNFSLKFCTYHFVSDPHKWKHFRGDQKKKVFLRGKKSALTPIRKIIIAQKLIDRFCLYLQITMFRHQTWYISRFNEIKTFLGTQMHNDSGRLLHVLINNNSFDNQVVQITLEIILISFKLYRNNNPCVAIKILRYQPNPLIRFWAMMILRIRVSNRLIFCYMSCLRAVKAQPYV